MRLRSRSIALFIALLVLAGPSPAHADDALTVVSWGGSYTRSQMLGFIRAYEDETGTDVDVIDYAGGLEEIRSQVRAHNVKWDAVDLELSDAIHGCREGLLAEIDVDALAPAPDGTPAREDFIDGSLHRCAVGSIVWSTIVAYDARAFPDEPPRALEDYFDLQRYPGPRGMRRTPKANLEWALLADGVPADRVYETLATEAGLSRAFRKLNAIKEVIVWWRHGAEAARMLETGRVTMSTAFNGRIHDAVAERGAPLAIIWDRQILDLDLWAIPARNEQRAAAFDFIRYATSTASLARQARYIAYGPARRSSLALLPAERRDRLPTHPDNLAGSLQLDSQWWAVHLPRLQARFEQWIERPVRVRESHPR